MLREPSGCDKCRVVGEPDHVELAAGALQMIEEPTKETVVISPVQMHDDFGLRVDGFDGVVAGVDQPRQVGVLIGGPSLWPEHAPGNLVPHLDPFGSDALFFEGGEYVGGELENVCFQLVDRMAGPGGGFFLVARVRPGVAVVKINQNAKTHLPCALGHDGDLIAATVSVALIR